MRLIDADSMKADLLTVNPQYETMIDWCIRVLDAQPTVERKTGKWIHNPDPMAGEGYWNCSECGLNVYTCTDFCPNCGSEMR